MDSDKLKDVGPLPLSMFSSKSRWANGTISGEQHRGHYQSFHQRMLREQKTPHPLSPSNIYITKPIRLVKNYGIYIIICHIVFLTKNFN